MHLRSQGARDDERYRPTFFVGLRLNRPPHRGAESCLKTSYMFFRRSLDQTTREVSFLKIGRLPHAVLLLDIVPLFLLLSCLFS